jgi:quercetin dioxygenase-like cupin family protein
MVAQVKLGGYGMHNHLIAATLFTTAAGALAAPIPIRTPIGSFAVNPAKTTSRIETTRVDFLPGEEMPRHMHPVPVVCFVAKGTFLVSIGSAPVRKVAIGDTTLEPAGEIVHYFRNASSNEPAQLYCAILAGKGDKELSIMLGK